MNPEQLLLWLLLPPTALVLSLVITWSARRYALARSLIDHPGDRSSHSLPTPRGGGLGLVVGILVCSTLLTITGHLDLGLGLALCIGGAAVAVVGAVDDHGHVAPQWRALVQLGAASFAVWQIGGLTQLSIGDWSWSLAWLGAPLAVIAITWLTNLTNFMDGIDGIAASQALFFGAASCLLLSDAGAVGSALIGLLLAAAALGFLYWNWPPARIFMGDVGSGFVGFIIAILALHGSNHYGIGMDVWLLLMALFIADASYTLTARLLKGETWYEAHRQHAYQRLVQHGYSHRAVTLGYSAINVLLLLPLAWWSYRQPAVAMITLPATYLLLWLLWWRIRATTASEAA